MRMTLKSKTMFSIEFSTVIPFQNGERLRNADHQKGRKEQSLKRGLP
jgi:hypothetical protein